MEIENSQTIEVMGKMKHFILNQRFKNSEKKLIDVQGELECEITHLRTLLRELSYGDKMEWINYHRAKGSLYYPMEGKLLDAFWEYYVAILAIDVDVKILRECGPDIVNNIGQVSINYKDHDLAKNCFEFVLYLDPRNVKAHFRLGKILGILQETKKAYQIFQKGMNLGGLDSQTMREFQNELNKLGKRNTDF